MKNFEKTGKEIDRILAENKIPEEFSDVLAKVFNDFEKNHADLKESNHAAYNILLMGTLYKAGKNQSKAAE